MFCEARSVPSDTASGVSEGMDLTSWRFGGVLKCLVIFIASKVLSPDKSTISVITEIQVIYQWGLP